jgi:hypothetical protein
MVVVFAVVRIAGLVNSPRTAPKVTHRPDAGRARAPKLSTLAAMDLQAIHAALASTLSANQAERHAAEASLKQLEPAAGFLSALCTVVSTAEVAADIRHSASIYFKNLVQKHWEHEQGVLEEGQEPPSVVFQENEKASIRASMLDAISCATPQTRPMMVESLRKICACDFPKKMGSFVQEIAGRLAPTLPPQQIFSGVLALRAVTKNFEYKKLEIRMQLNDIMAVTFPAMAVLLEATLNVAVGDEHAAEMQKAMLKTIWSCVQQSIPLYLQDPNMFAQWMSFLYRVIERPVPPETAHSSDDAPSVFWKCRRWSAKIVQRIFSKYGNPKVCAKQMDGRHGKEGEVAIARVFHDHLASRFLTLFMQVLSTKAQGVYLLERFVVEAINYIVIAVTLAETWKFLRPNVMPLVCQVLFPMMCFDDRDAELWADDPTEFVRKTYDVMEDFESQRVASSNLIIDLCKKRTKSCLMPILEFCVKQLSDYQAGTGSPRAKDGAMYCIGALANQLQEQGTFAQQLGWLLSNHVAPEFKSPHGHLRSRACWISAELVDTVSKDPAFFQSTVSAVIGLLRDKELPVRFQAAVALRMLIYDGEKGAARAEVKDAVGQVLPQLLQELFNLMDEVGSDELIATMDVLIESYADQMAPYAQGLCQRLAEHFLRLASLQGDEANEESSLAACQCCSAITTLLESVKKTPELYHSLEPSLVPLIGQVLSPDKDGEYQFMEFMEDALEILTYLTYYSPTISPAVWSLYKPLTSSFFEWAFDYLSNINMSMDNYISRGNEVFLSDPGHIELVCRMVEKVMTGDESSERDVVEGCKLLESLVLNCKGRIDPYIPPLVGLVVKRFQGEVKKEFCRTELLKALANCLYYGAELVLRALEDHGATGFMFQTWFTAIVQSKEEELEDGSKVQEKTHFKGVHDRKVCILGLSSILRVPAASLPPTVQGGLGHIVAAAVTLLQDIEAARRRKEAEAEDDGDDEESSGPAGIQVRVVPKAMMLRLVDVTEDIICRRSDPSMSFRLVSVISSLARLEIFPGLLSRNHWAIFCVQCSSMSASFFETSFRPLVSP